MCMLLMGCGSGGGGFNPLSLNPTLWALPANSFSRTGGQFTAASSQYLSVASNSSLQSGGRFWVSFWVYFDTDPFTQHIICKGNIGGNSVFEYSMFVLSGVFRLSIGNGVAITGLNHTFNPAATTWYHCFGFGEAGGTMGMLIDGENLITASAPATFLDGTGSLGLGYQVDGGIGYHNGRLDNVLFGKPPTSLGDGTSGSLAHTIATTLYNSGNGLAFQDITAQQESDWGIVSGWLDNSLTADAFGSNTLNNIGVTQAAGKVNAVAVDNDPTYFVNDASANDNDLTQVTLANRPIYKSAGYWTFDGVNDDLVGPLSISNVSKLAMFVICDPFVIHPANQVVVGGESGAFQYQILNGGKYFYASTSNYGYATESTDGWHIALSVFDGTQTGNANRLKAYINGGSNIITNFNGVIPATVSSSGVRISATYLTAAARYKGDLACLLILTDYTVSQLNLVGNYLVSKYPSLSLSWTDI